MNTTTHNHTRFALAAVAAACLGCVAIGAPANAANEAAAVTVHYSDVNLNTQAGAATLYRRIRQAAEQVCGDEGSRQLAEAVAAKACVNRAIVASVQSVNNLRLTSEYNRHTGKADAINVASL